MEVIVNQIEQRSWIEVNLDQLMLNYTTYKSLLPKGTDIMAVVKADAYGHGDHLVTRWLAREGCKAFAVSNIDEAVGLREAGIEGEILILGYSSPKFARILYSQHLTQAIVSEEYAEALAQTGYNVKCQFAIDTGMNRIGLDGDNPERCCEVIHLYANRLNIDGIFTHLCVADSIDEGDKEFTRTQIRKFEDVARGVVDMKLPFVHCYNSAGGMDYLPQFVNNKDISRIVRLGIVLYGLKPSDDIDLPEEVKPAVEWKSVVSMVKTVHRGETLGYGRTFEVERESRIATVATGYADGLNRLLSNRGFVMIDGQKAPIVGRICMDQTLVDVTDIPNVKMGSVVTIIGKSGDLIYTADDMADELGTIGYEVMCNITKRVQRFYKTHGLLYTL